MAAPSKPPCKSATAPAIANMAGSSFVEFDLDHPDTANLAAGDAVSEGVSAGGHRWIIRCYPRGLKDNDISDCISLFLELRSRSAATGVRAIFQAFLTSTGDGGAAPSPWCSRHVYRAGDSWGWRQIARRADFGLVFAGGGGSAVKLVCGVVVVGDDATIAVPPSDVGAHLGHLLDSAAATSDISFVVGGETFPAHRAVIAARSPVLNAALFPSTADGAARPPSTITLQDIEPATFRLMLRFMYTDALPEDDELDQETLTDLMQHLLAAADRFAMDRLKLMCARKLRDNITVDTFASTLACAVTYNCPELKRKCIGFFAMDDNFKKIAFTDRLMWLLEKFPALEAELKESIGI